MQKTDIIQQIRCHILLTNTARQALTEHISDEHAFFKLQQHFLVHIEKVSVDEKVHLTLYFDDEKNVKLQQKFAGRVVIMDCVFDLKQGLVAKSFRTRGKGTPVSTNRRIPIKIHFIASRISGHKYASEFIQTINALPISSERYDFVNKRISSWEGYLKVLEKNAAIDDIQAKFSKPSFNGDYTKMTITCNNIENKAWKQLKGLAARIRGVKQDVGQVLKVSRADRTVEIELKPEFAKFARKGDYVYDANDIEFSNAATKSQLRRLLKGFERLKEGLAANANLENILFEDQPAILPQKDIQPLQFHNALNEFQREAVTGAMRADDLYVIQGPPGTGKTTVISEICYQNAKAGLKTLVASQSNLAVDNALSRLLSNKDIRILRYGRTESIEEEGKKFIEENVAAYWKEQTLSTVTYEIEHYQSKEQQIANEINALKEQLISLEEQNKQLESQIENKKTAAKEKEQLLPRISELKKEVIQIKNEKQRNEELLEKLNFKKTEFDKTIANLSQNLAEYPAISELEQTITKLQQQLTTLQDELEYLELTERKARIQLQMTKISNDMDNSRRDDQIVDGLLQELASLKKVVEVEAFMDRNHIRRSYVMHELLKGLDRIQADGEQYKMLKATTERLEKAIEYSKNTLQIHVVPEVLQEIHPYNLEEVAEFLAKLSKAFAEKRINRENGQRSIQGLLLRQQFLQQLHLKFDAYIREALLIFEKLKEEVIKQFAEQASNSQQVIDKLLSEKEKLTHQQLEITNAIQALNVTTTSSKDDLQLNRLTNDQKLQQLKKQLTEATNITQQKSLKVQELEKLQEQLDAGDTLIKQLNEKYKEVNITGIQYEKQLVELEQLLNTNPEDALKKNQNIIKEITEQLPKLEKKLQLIPITEELQQQWKGMLENATEHDLDEIRKLYVKHANVIGTTCVASANKEFMENYPTFDVVIIDEVSKATPPELLLPMLKGAKVILVGDHHQLPPLIGDDTFEETLEEVLKENTSFEEKRELEKLLEESLFERLYKNLPKQNKQMLAIQYRMHANIMQTIAPFYAFENDALQCGLEDSDKLRDHLLETPLFNRGNHLLWVDLPNKPAYFEERVKEGSSLFNKAELKEIEKLLVEMNEATARAKDEGLIAVDARKSVGVISFYAEQVKRINHLIEQQLHLPHLHIRTGSVDKFQGMEMDVILVSMVRNHDHKGGEIGFAKDYRRLNVALSRARELLVLIGSADMFTKKPKKANTREMYESLYKTVVEQGGHRLQIENVVEV